MPNPSEITRVDQLYEELANLEEECEREPTGSLISHIEALKAEIQRLTHAD